MVTQQSIVDAEIRVLLVGHSDAVAGDGLPAFSPAADVGILMQFDHRTAVVRISETAWRFFAIREPRHGQGSHQEDSIQELRRQEAHEHRPQQCEPAEA